MSKPTKLRIGILGAGIIGLTCAIRIKEQFPDAKIIVYAGSFSPNTTSDVSAGLWEPYCLSSSAQQSKILKWGKETYDVMLKTAYSEAGGECGVQSLSSYVIQFSEKTRTPYWSNIVSQYRELNAEDFKSALLTSDPRFKSGFHFITTTVTMNRYLPYLMRILDSKGVKFVKREFKDLNEILSESEKKGFDYIVNCTGLAAGKLFNDPKVHPVRGHVLRIKAPWIKNCIMFDDETTYILPLSELVVIGGTAEKGVYDLNPNEEEFKKIVERVSAVVPSIKTAEVYGKYAGLRPGREDGIRLEMEYMRKNDSVFKIIHNYGHGGSGVTLGWGCATDVLEIIQNDLKLKSKL